MSSIRNCDSRISQFCRRVPSRHCATGAKIRLRSGSCLWVVNEKQRRRTCHRVQLLWAPRYPRGSWMHHPSVLLGGGPFAACQGVCRLVRRPCHYFSIASTAEPNKSACAPPLGVPTRFERERSEKAVQVPRPRAPRVDRRPPGPTPDRRVSALGRKRRLCGVERTGPRAQVPGLYPGSSRESDATRIDVPQGRR